MTTRAVILVTLVLCCIQVLVAEEEKDCEWTSKTEPDALIGTVGSDKDRDYYFTHLSDVDKAGKIYQYVYIIRNKHEKNYLPAEWKVASLDFARIEPNGCLRNDFQSGFPHEEHPNAMLLYGATKEKQKKAPLYLVKADDKERESAAPALRSRLYAKLIGKVIDIRFDSTFNAEKKMFRYDITNHASGEESRFSLAALTDAWDKVAEKKVVTKWTKTTAEGERPTRFVLKREQKVLTTFEVISDAKPVERQVVIKVYTNKDNAGDPIATGQFSCYLPKLPR